MNIYLTSGTKDFMETLRKRYLNETLIVMHGDGNSVLLHETEGKSFFQTPRRYEVVSAIGALNEEGFFAFNNVPVSEEGRPIFEHRLQSKIGKIEEEPGFVAFRLLRPLKSDTFIVLTQWETSAFFDSWKNTDTYHQVHESNESGASLDRMPHIFSSAAYVTTYITKHDPDEDTDENV